MKKRISMILAMVTLFSLFMFSTGAEGIEKTAKTELKIGKSYNLSIPIKDEAKDYKIIMPKTGNLKLKYTNYTQEMAWNLFDSIGAEVPATNYNASAGTINRSTYNNSTYYSGYYNSLTGNIYYTNWNDVSEKGVGEVTYKIEKGTYYLRITRNNVGIGDLKLSLSAKDLDGNTIKSTTSTVTSASLSITLSEGETIQLGTVLTPTDVKETVSWKSSKSSVASVSSNGKVTAKEKGKTTITMKVDSISLKIIIIVS